MKMLFATSATLISVHPETPRRCQEGRDGAFTEPLVRTGCRMKGTRQCPGRYLFCRRSQASDCEGLRGSSVPASTDSFLMKTDIAKSYRPNHSKMSSRGQIII